MKTIIAKTPTDVHRVLRHTLSARDYTVLGLPSDADVFEAIGQIGPDLVILALEELHLCSSLRQRWPALSNLFIGPGTNERLMVKEITTMDNTQNEPDLEERKISPLSWNEFHSLTVALVQKMQAAPPPDIIVGLQRGGLIPAVTLSHHIGTQLLLSLPIRSTTSDEIYATKTPPAVGTLPLFEQIEGKRVLVVDDIVGSGATLRAALSLLHRYEPACIQSVVYVVNRGHWNSVNHCAPTESITYIGKELSGWVVFPWEKGEQRAGPAETRLYRPHAGSDHRS